MEEHLYKYNVDKIYLYNSSDSNNEEAVGFVSKLF